MELKLSRGTSIMHAYPKRIWKLDKFNHNGVKVTFPLCQLVQSLSEQLLDTD